MFLLSSENHHHSADVRGVCALPDALCTKLGIPTNSFATASRDTQVAIWSKKRILNINLLLFFFSSHIKATQLIIKKKKKKKKKKKFNSLISAGSGRYSVHAVLRGHTHFASCVSADGDSIVSGGHDMAIHQWPAESVCAGEVTSREVGRFEGAVVSVVAMGEGEVAASSWDKTARVVARTAQDRVLKGHEQAVWGVVALPGGDRLATAGADRVVAIWDRATGRRLSTTVAHEDCVRGLCNVPGGALATCSNDNLVKVWEVSGTDLRCALTLPGHTQFVYCVVHNDARPGELATASEDGTARVWKDGECVAVLRHPSTVWTVCALPNGDLVTGCSDGVVRVWTCDPSRVASDEEIAAHQAALDAAEAAVLEAKRDKLKKLPGLEALAKPGAREGASVVVRNGDKAEAYSWSQGQWALVGEVVDPPSADSGAGLGKKTLFGVEYDLVFDVDLGDGHNRQIGHNLGANPYTTAQEFIDREEIGQDFLQQIADFIEANTPKVVSQEPAQAHWDPYNGANVYTPGAKPNPDAARAAAAAAAAAAARVADPAAALAPPLAAPFTFEPAKFQPALAKMAELGGLTEADEAAVRRIVAVLEDRRRYHASQVAHADVDCLVRLALAEASPFPVDKRFAALDVFRAGLLHAHFSERLLDPVGRLLAVAETPNAGAATTLMALRGICNLFANRRFQRELSMEAGMVLDLCAANVSGNAQTRLAVASLIANYGLLMFELRATMAAREYKLQALSALAALKAKEDDAEVAARITVAVKAITHHDKDAQEAARGFNLT
jgi:phospholipase A-2-activating protein